jgi:hypothetical protein
MSVRSLPHVTTCDKKTLPDLRSSYIPKRPAQFGTHGQLYTYIKGSPAETKNPTQRKLIGCSMTAPAGCVIAQQYCFGNFVSLHFHSHQENLGARFRIVVIYILLLFQNSVKSEIA